MGGKQNYRMALPAVMTRPAYSTDNSSQRSPDEPTCICVDLKQRCDLPGTHPLPSGSGLDGRAGLAELFIQPQVRPDQKRSC